MDKGETVTLGATTLRSDGAEPVEEALDAGTRVARYRIASTLGSGGMGVVYLADDPELDRRVALKLVRRGTGGKLAEANLVREAQAMAKLQHPNVVTVYDVGVYENRVFVAMELVDGLTLREWLANERPSLRRILGAFVDAGRGLGAAHAAGLVHRDFKPENVLIGRDGVARVTDFGLARALRAPPGEPGSNAVTAPVTGGTPRYMAPEQHDGAAVTEAADQYAFATALWEAVAGEHPIRFKTESEIASAKRAGLIGPAPPGMPRWLAKILRRSLAPEPRDRFASTAELVARIERRQRRRTLIVVAMGGVALASAVATFAIARGDQVTPRAVTAKQVEAKLAELGSPNTMNADPTQCQQLPFADSTPTPEASGAAWLVIDGKLALVVVSDSSSNGAFAVIDPETGETREQGELPLGTGAKDDIEGLAAYGEKLYGLTSDGWLRVWRRTGSGFELVDGPYAIGEAGVICDHHAPYASKKDCTINYEGLALAATLQAGCAGFACSKGLGRAYCLVERDGRYVVDPKRSIAITKPHALADCTFDDRDRLWAGSNVFGLDQVFRVDGWQQPATAKVVPTNAFGIGVPEVIAVRGDIFYRMSDTNNPPSLMAKFRCRVP